MDPIRFQPVFRRYLWGGFRLARDLGKQTGAESCAESWEVVDHPQANSIVLDGPFAELSLQQLIQQQMF